MNYVVPFPAARSQ